MNRDSAGGRVLSHTGPSIFWISRLLGPCWDQTLRRGQGRQHQSRAWCPVRPIVRGGAWGNGLFCPRRANPRVLRQGSFFSRDQRHLVYGVGGSSGMGGDRTGQGAGASPLGPRRIRHHSTTASEEGRAPTLGWIQPGQSSVSLKFPSTVALASTRWPHGCRSRVPPAWGGGFSGGTGRDTAWAPRSRGQLQRARFFDGYVSAPEREN
jgi:hypothetical protein